MLDSEHVGLDGGVMTSVRQVEISGKQLYISGAWRREWAGARAIESISIFCGNWKCGGE